MQKKIMSFFRVSVLLTIVLFMTGCVASKGPLDTISSKSSLEGKTLVIGTISRPAEYTGYQTMGLSLLNLNNNEKEQIIVRAGEKFNAMLEFDNDYKYVDREGNIFAVLVPSGEYLLTDYSSRFNYGYGGFEGDYSRKISLKSGEIVYIGDMKVLPGDIAGARLCVISDQLDRDYNVFKKHYTTAEFAKNNIKTNIDKTSFNIFMNEAEALNEHKEKTNAINGALIQTIILSL